MYGSEAVLEDVGSYNFGKVRVEQHSLLWTQFLSGFNQKEEYSVFNVLEKNNKTFTPQTVDFSDLGTK